LNLVDEPFEFAYRVTLLDRLRCRGLHDHFARPVEA
jgi:hypothetical protein